MAWEKRNGNYYYYRKERTDHRVVSIYVGNDELARMIVQLIELKAEGQFLELKLLNLNKTQAQNVASTINLVDEMVKDLVYATLIITGHHTHKGQWRKTRNE